MLTLPRLTPVTLTVPEKLLSFSVPPGASGTVRSTVSVCVCSSALATAVTGARQRAIKAAVGISVCFIDFSLTLIRRRATPARCLPKAQSPKPNVGHGRRSLPV